MNPIHRSPRRGAVLLLVLGAVSVLAVLAVEVAHRSQVQTVEVARYGREGEFRRLFDSGIEAAKGLLAEKRADPRFDCWGDGWSDQVTWELGTGRRVTLRVEDESGKINILRARDPAGGAWTRGAITRLFEYLRKADPEREQEWRQTEVKLWRRLGVTAQEEEDAGGRPQATSNEKFEDPPLTLDGLREAGIPMEVVFRAMDAEKPRPSLDRYLTTFGDGKVNLNTAPLAVLYALDPGLDEDLAWQVAAWRGGEDPEHTSSSNRAFLRAMDLERVPGVVQKATVDGEEQVIRNIFTDVQDHVGVKGQIFSVRMTAEVDGRKRQAIAYLQAGAATGGGSAMDVLAFEEIEP